MVCGYLASDLSAVADEILLAPPEPDVIEARDLREAETPPPEPVEEPEPEPEPVEEPDEELEPVAESNEESYESGVTSSADWEPTRTPPATPRPSSQNSPLSCLMGPGAPLSRTAGRKSPFGPLLIAAVKRPRAPARRTNTR